jgi:uncharacterized surface protein with fasciclin (FAS1) repeats
MATAPVMTAAAASPVLSTFVTAIRRAGLSGALNSAANVTVFAPDNAAFVAIPPATLRELMADRPALAKILRYHVVPGRYTPNELANGTPIKTLEGALMLPGLVGSTYTVDGAKIVCGNVETANATVYIINAVLVPSS